MDSSLKIFLETRTIEEIEQVKLKLNHNNNKNKREKKTQTHDSSTCFSPQGENPWAIRATHSAKTQNINPRKCARKCKTKRNNQDTESKYLVAEIRSLTGDSAWERCVGEMKIGFLRLWLWNNGFVLVDSFVMFSWGWTRGHNWNFGSSWGKLKRPYAKFWLLGPAC
ncbi:hypothetical protein VNO77_39389 [Canavalia gladiata]|uniref:Uncharacterized protein n=1 Tax=Canavalia gladiata TaxID=3824 RepID=A0AAN9PXQ0_CANGL